MQQLVRGLGTLSLVFILFFCTSGGPYTTETLIHSLGPGLGLIILLFVPLIGSLPEMIRFGGMVALANTSLSERLDHLDVFVSRHGNLSGPLHSVSALLAPGLGTRLEWLLSLVMIWGATAINLRGSVRVGRASIIAGAFVMLGFLAMSITATPHLTHIPWQPFASEKGKGIGAFAVGISIELWNYIGLGQRLDRARRSERCNPRLPARARHCLAVRDHWLLHPIAYCARGE